MAHKVTPSRRKFRIAKEFARALAADLGKDLKAVFVTGSVAANMANPRSDIDIVVIVKNPDHYFHFPTAERIFRKCAATGGEHNIDFFVVDTKTFGNPGKDRIVQKWPAGYAMQKGALPIFGDRKYLQRLAGKFYNLPNKERVLGKYVPLKEGLLPGEKLLLHNRIKFKRSKKGLQRFSPR